jgi:hypothetical protein
MSLTLLVGVASTFAQAEQGRDMPQQPPANRDSYSGEARYQRSDSSRQAQDGRNNQQGSRQGRLSPEERQALRRQIDEAGHDIYRPRR